MINFAKENDIDPKLLSAVWEKNLAIRKNKDWLKLEGRAISYKEKK